MSLQKESEWEKVWKDNCFCIPAYKDRGMVDPGCAYCNTFDEVKDAIAEAILEERRMKTMGIFMASTTLSMKFYS